MTWMVKTGWSHEVADWYYITEDRTKRMVEEARSLHSRNSFFMVRVGLSWCRPGEELH